MDLTIKKMREILADLPDNCDDVIIAGLELGDRLNEYEGIKRVLFLKKDKEELLVINPMGTHYFDLVEKHGFHIIKYWQ